MFGFKRLGYTRVPHRKNTKDLEAVRFTPTEVLLPTVQHIGAPAVATVKVGDTVKIGDMVAEAGGYVSAPIYATVSGKVTKIEEYLRPDGKRVPAIRIESDGLMERANVTPPEVYDLDSLVDAVRVSGIVGLGGAGFPTAVKLDAAKKGTITTLVLNGAECEPYITSDTRTMLESSDLLHEGIELLLRYIASLKNVYIGIEKNKPECISHLTEKLADIAAVKVVPLASLYPQGAEKVLIYNTTGTVITEGSLPADHGVLVINVSTLAELMKYIKTGMPLVERTFTVDGSGVSEPKNITAPIGTKICDVLEFAGVKEESIGKVIYGGPMMGIAVCFLTEPIIKTTNAITVLNERDARVAEPSACIHCGRCIAACPLHLNPTGYAKALNIDNKEDRIARLEDGKVNLCMECGCCSFVCPASRPLVQNNRIAKAQVREHNSHLATLAK